MIIITGANGFIGQKLVPLVLKRFPNEKIHCLIKGKNNLPKNKNLKVTQVDLVTKYNLDKIPNSPRIVIHLAGSTDTSQNDHRCNDIGTKNLLERLTDIDSKTHFIFTSSLAIYSGRKNTQKPIMVSTLPFPSNEYGRSKLRGEEVLFAASKNKGFKITVVRFPTVWGENPRKNSFLSFLKKLVKNDSLFARIDWPGKTALMNVDDAAAYLLKMALNKPKDNVTIPVAVENLTLANIFEILTKSQGKIYKKINLFKPVWNLAKFLRNYLAYFEPILPPSLYNYFWRASIIVDNTFWCKENANGVKFSSDAWRLKDVTGVTS